jgi:hypothetical protein
MALELELSLDGELMVRLPSGTLVRPPTEGLRFWLEDRLRAQAEATEHGVGTRASPTQFEIDNARRYANMDKVKVQEFTPKGKRRLTLADIGF